jgi:hypothetical protein
MGSWERAIRARFGDREDLGTAGVHTRFWPHLPRDQFDQLAQLLDAEYRIPVGLLRPEDALSKFSDPVPTRNPWRWLSYRTAEGDRWSEINYQLVHRLDRRGAPLPKPPAMTVDALVRVWCGEELGDHRADAG